MVYATEIVNNIDMQIYLISSTTRKTKNKCKSVYTLRKPVLLILS